jgi:hypothetical protein
MLVHRSPCAVLGLLYILNRLRQALTNASRGVPLYMLCES